MNRARLQFVVLGAVALLLGAVGYATAQGGSGKDKDFDAQAAFNELKKLEGTWDADWEGRDYGPPDRPVVVRYEIIADGTVVSEISAEGTPDEMTTNYTVDHNDLVVSHFCALGNQPKMKLNRGGGGKGKKLGFAKASVGNLKPNVPYMVLIAIDPVSETELRTTWQTRTGNDKVGGTHIVTLKRRG